MNAPGVRIFWRKPPLLTRRLSVVTLGSHVRTFDLPVLTHRWVMRWGSSAAWLPEHAALLPGVPVRSTKLPVRPNNTAPRRGTMEAESRGTVRRSWRECRAPLVALKSHKQRALIRLSDKGIRAQHKEQTRATKGAESGKMVGRLWRDHRKMTVDCAARLCPVRDKMLVENATITYCYCPVGTR